MLVPCVGIGSGGWAWLAAVDLCWCLLVHSSPMAVAASLALFRWLAHWCLPGCLPVGL